MPEPFNVSVLVGNIIVCGSPASALGGLKLVLKGQ